MASLKQEVGVSALTKAALGRELSLSEVAAAVGLDDLRDSVEPNGKIWVGSIGYENYKDVSHFGKRLHEAGVERLIDVRELPMSRRRGYAKTALRTALAEWDIEYLHLRALGNPKPLRDLYKTGRVAEGREGFSRLLLKERMDHLREMPQLLREKRSALMCVEHDEDVCHRQVILNALENDVGVQLEVSRLG